MRCDLYLNGNKIGGLEGLECVYETYKKTCELVDLLGSGWVDLVDAFTGEILETYKGEEEEEELPPSATMTDEELFREIANFYYEYLKS